jgi:hypothetical protein
MSTSTGPATRGRIDRRRRRRSSRNRIVVALALLIAFGVGVALGQALHDNPRPGGVQTSFRTIPPLTGTTSH